MRGTRPTCFLILFLVAAVVVVPAVWPGSCRGREGLASPSDHTMDEDEVDAADEDSKKQIRSYLSDVYPTDDEMAERKKCEEKLTSQMHLDMMRSMRDPADTIRYVSVQTINSCVRDSSHE